jgi:Tellurite resistance protein TerB.
VKTVVLFNIAEKRGITQEEIHEIIFSPGKVYNMPETIEEKVALLYDLARIAWADGIIEDAERNMMSSVIHKLGFRTEKTQAIIEFLLSETQKGTTEEQLLTYFQS